MKKSSDSIGENQGNTYTDSLKKQDGACKGWCFTLNNYSDEEYNSILVLINENEGIVGKEKGEQGTPHLQGYIKFVKPIRLTGLKKLQARCHWEKAKGSCLQNFQYCSKEGEFFQNLYDDDVLSYPKHPIFEDLMDVISKKPDKRHIHVVIDKKGGIGKTSFTKFLFHNRKGVFVLSGKGNDMKCAVKMLKGDPKIIIVDCPRVSNSFISWQGIEELKNGLFFSGKYEPDMVSYKIPHVIVMMNQDPDLDALSMDRWVLHRRVEE